MQLSTIKLTLPSWRNRLMAATALLSVALIAYQLAIIQLLSYLQWHHYANMVISIALLGFGAAGTVLSLLRKRAMFSATVPAKSSMSCGT